MKYISHKINRTPLYDSDPITSSFTIPVNVAALNHPWKESWVTSSHTVVTNQIIHEIFEDGSVQISRSQTDSPFKYHQGDVVSYVPQKVQIIRNRFQGWFGPANLVLPGYARQFHPPVKKRTFSSYLRIPPTAIYVSEAGPCWPHLCLQ